MSAAPFKRRSSAQVAKRKPNSCVIHGAPPPLWEPLSPATGRLGEREGVGLEVETVVESGDEEGG
jgi:hypothetical protein